MKVLGIVPAQGRSVAVPMKNIVEVCGKPLLVWTIESAIASRRLTSVVVSTEHPQIAAVATSHATVRLIGQPEFPSSLEMLQWASAEVGCRQFDAVMCLQPTCPLRRAEDIDAAIQLMERTGCDSVVSYVSVGANHPARMARIVGDSRVLPVDAGSTFARRQDLDEMFIRSGDIYLTKTDVLMSGSLVGKDQRALIIDSDRWCNIDVPIDVALAEARIKYLEVQQCR